jgi:hypothetical protein
MLSALCNILVGQDTVWTDSVNNTGSIEIENNTYFLITLVGNRK